MYTVPQIVFVLFTSACRNATKATADDRLTRGRQRPIKKQYLAIRYKYVYILNNYMKKSLNK